jgi:hypothetical protein
MMTFDEDRPTIGERYTCATGSSDLHLHNERRGHVDVIIAAGLVREGLGTDLYRLMSEFDALRAPIDAAKRWVASQVAMVATLRAAASLEDSRSDAGGNPCGDVAMVRALTARADRLQAAAVASLRVEFALVLSGMVTLPHTRDHLGAFALEQARIKRIDRSPRDLMHITGRCLDAFLDPLCHVCDGRGFIGGGRHEHTGVQVICRPCKGSGHRRDSIGKDDVERLFAGHLLMRMDAMLHEVQRGIARGLRLVSEAKCLLASAATAR